MAAKKRTHPIHTLDLRQPPVDREEMRFALGVFQAGLRLRMPMESPAKKGIPIEDKVEGERMLEPLPPEVRELFTIRDDRVSPKDTPLHRAVFGVMDHYKDHPQQQAISTRLGAFYFLVNDVRETGRWDKWQKPSEEDAEAMMLHPAVVDAIATVPLTKFGNFKEAAFFAAVEKIAKEEYGNED
jgi:hypothetical protein